MFKSNWSSMPSIILILIVTFLSSCTTFSTTEKYILTVNVEQTESTPTVKIYADGEEIDSKEGKSVQFELRDGEYIIKVKADNDDTQTRDVLINGSDVTKDITFSDLKIPEDDWEPGDGWELKWSDEFDSAEIDESNWTRQELPAGKFNNEWQEYTDSPDNSYIKRDADGNGAMVIEAKHEEDGFGEGNFTSARMITNEKAEFKYGKIAARIKVPEGQGIWPAFWMLGTNIDETGGDTPWPWAGEIDIMEKVGGNEEDERTVHGHLHYSGCEYDPDQDWQQCYNAPGDSKTIEEPLAADYRVYEIEWDEEVIIWRLDGEEYHRQDISGDEFYAFREEFYIILNVAVGGDWPQYPDESTEFPQRMYVDWVRVYQ